jgi:hypothetical protein
MMTTTLSEEFADALERIGIKRAAAMAAHAEVRTHLELDPKLSEWGVDTILIGSYARKTAIHPCHDVDVFVKLPSCEETNPETVFAEVRRVLVAAYGDRASEQRRSMCIRGFGANISVDAVPAVPYQSHWQIPQTATQQFGGRWLKDRWEHTNPEQLTELTHRMQERGPSVAGNNAYIRIVRFIKQIRDTQLGPAKPGGLYVELLTYWAFAEGVAGNSYAELLAATLNSIASQLSSGATVIEPAMDATYSPAPDPGAISAAALGFSGIAAEARRALTLETCPAAAAWRRILGQNANGWVFPLPQGCDELGRTVTPLHATPDLGPQRARPFA